MSGRVVGGAPAARAGLEPAAPASSARHTDSSKAGFLPSDVCRARLPLAILFPESSGLDFAPTGGLLPPAGSDIMRCAASPRDAASRTCGELEETNCSSANGSPLSEAGGLGASDGVGRGGACAGMLP